MNPDTAQLMQRIQFLETELNSVKKLLGTHQHTINDGTSPIRKSIIIDPDQYFGVGNMQILTFTRTTGTADEVYAMSTSVGPDSIGAPLFKSENMELNFLHYPQVPQSFLSAKAKPLVTSFENTSITTSSGGSTVTITGYGFVTNSLAGALINIYNSSGALVETQVIASNTATVVTIVGTWLASTSGGTFDIFKPVYLGSAEKMFQRVYTQEDTAGGIRFGGGVTGGGQNGLLYMDATGDLYWRDKAGTSIKLN